MNKTSRIDLAGVFKHRANRVLASFWEKQRLPRFVHEQRFPTHYQTLSTRKNWLSCIQNTLLAFCHTGPTKRIEKKSGRIEKAGRIKIYWFWKSNKISHQIYVFGQILFSDHTTRPYRNNRNNTTHESKTHAIAFGKHNPRVQKTHTRLPLELYISFSLKTWSLYLRRLSLSVSY